MKATPLAIRDFIHIEPRVFGDEQGFLFETPGRVLSEATIGEAVQFLQESGSSSVKDVLPGLRYQIQQPQGSLVRVVQGKSLADAERFA